MAKEEAPNFIVNDEGDVKPAYNSVNQPRYHGTGDNIDHDLKTIPDGQLPPVEPALLDPAVSARNAVEGSTKSDDENPLFGIPRAKDVGRRRRKF